MKYLVLVLIATAVVVANARPDQYTSKYDNVDIDEILKSDRLLRNYVNCLLGTGKCTPDGAELKKNLPDALETGCTKCTEKQREGSKKVIHYLIEKKRPWWDELAVKYDPTGKYTKKYEEEAKQQNN
uniref:Chemosensory protein 6 n=1 Tax=Lissorhoptrus oryzophilus TaxID=308863 RepID=A0A0B4KZD7_9CUCU|nr:chemosensory protein 6 [Lissorhoptrus oryzophilus]